MTERSANITWLATWAHSRSGPRRRANQCTTTHVDRRMEFALRAYKRIPAVFSLLLVLMLSLTACMHVDRNVTLNSDGSGSYVLTIGFSEQLVSLASDQISSSMDDFGQKVKQQGGSYRHYDDTGYSYWAYTRPFKTVADLNKLVQEAPQSGDSSSADVTTPGQDTLTFSEQSGFLSNTFHVTGHMSMVVPPSSLGDTGGVDITQYLKDMRESFSVTMPGSITSHTGGVVSGNTVTYTVHYGEQTDIDVVGGGLNLGPLLPIGAAVIVILLLAIVGAILWSRRRKRAATSHEQPGAPAYVPAYMPGPAAPDAPTVVSQGETSGEAGAE